MALPSAERLVPVHSGCCRKWYATSCSSGWLPWDHADGPRPRKSFVLKWDEDRARQSSAPTLVLHEDIARENRPGGLLLQASSPKLPRSKRARCRAASPIAHHRCFSARRRTRPPHLCARKLLQCAPDVDRATLSGGVR